MFRLSAHCPNALKTVSNGANHYLQQNHFANTKVDNVTVTNLY